MRSQYIFSKSFFLAQEFFSCSKKKILAQEKKSLKNVLFLHYIKGTFFGHKKTFLWELNIYILLERFKIFKKIARFSRQRNS